MESNSDSEIKFETAENALHNKKLNDFYMNILSVTDPEIDISTNLRQKAIDLFNHVESSYITKYELPKQKAIEFYKQKAKNPKNSYSSCFLGKCYLIGYGVEIDHWEAKRLYEQAITADENNYVAMQNLGYLHEIGSHDELYDINKAIALYEKAAEKGYAPALHSLSFVNIYGIGISPNIEKGLHTINKPNKISSLTKGVYGCMFAYHYKIINYDKALTYFTEAYNEGCHYSLIKIIYVCNIIKKFMYSVKEIKDKCYTMISDLEEMTNYFHPNVLVWLAEIYHKGIKYNNTWIIRANKDKALEYANKCYEDKVLDSNKYYCLAKIYFENNENDKAIELLKKGIKIWNLHAIYGLADYYNSLGEYDMAMNLYEKGMTRLCPSSMIGAGTILYNQGKYDEALELFKRAKKHGTVATPWFIRFYEQKWDDEHAVKYMHIGYKLRHSYAMLKLANHYVNNNDLDQATEICNEVLNELDNTSEKNDAYILLAQVYAKKMDDLRELYYYIKANETVRILSILTESFINKHKKTRYDELIKTLAKWNNTCYFYPKSVIDDIDKYKINNIKIEI